MFARTRDPLNRRVRTCTEEKRRNVNRVIIIEADSAREKDSQCRYIRNMAARWLIIMRENQLRAKSN